jgi:hypothetical protein
MVEAGSERAPLSIGGEFEDRTAPVHHKEIALVVKSQVSRILDPGGEGTLLSIRCEFGDRVTNRHKEIALVVKGQVRGAHSTGWAADPSEGAPFAIGREFDDLGKLRFKEIARWVKSEATGMSAKGKQDCSQAGNYQGGERCIHKFHPLAASLSFFEMRRLVKNRGKYCLERGVILGINDVVNAPSVFQLNKLENEYLLLLRFLFVK